MRSSWRFHHACSSPWMAHCILRTMCARMRTGNGFLNFPHSIRPAIHPINQIHPFSYACTLSLAAIQSAQHGPFFRLHLPLGHINPKQLMKQQPASKQHLHQHPHAFPPRIDEFQPLLFPAVPTRGQFAYLECFAYGL